MEPVLNLWQQAEFVNLLRDEICGGFDEHCTGHYLRRGGTRVQ